MTYDKLLLIPLGTFQLLLKYQTMQVCENTHTSLLSAQLRVG